MIFLIAGGSGFIGSLLTQNLLQQQHQVIILTRKTQFQSKNITNSALQFVNNLYDIKNHIDVVINLTGSPISSYWTSFNKEKIWHSRISTTKNLVNFIATQKKPPQLFISASAIGYYGTNHHTIFSENSQASKQNLFSQQLCDTWEKEASVAKPYTRLVLLRTGVVLAKNSGILKKILPSFNLGLGGIVGSGQQPISWIHWHDLIRAINFIINTPHLSGPVNLVASHNTFSEFVTSLTKKLHRPCFIKTPAWLVKILFGQMGCELILAGQRVSSFKLNECGFNFDYYNLDLAFNNIFTS
jgi:uncharacterized protein (TIGR01777 family)